MTKKLKFPTARMYQLALRPDQIRALYFLKARRRTPMTRLLQEAVDTFLAPFGGTAGLIPKEEASPGQGDSAGRGPSSR